MICERCGREIADNASICPSCGTVTSAFKGTGEASTSYGQYPQYGQYWQPGNPSYQPLPGYEQGYAQQQGYTQPASPQQDAGYGQAYPYPPPGYGPGPVNVTVINNVPSTRNNTPLIVEVILSLFGIFGVGWLMAGETTTGVILLICSFVIYWPIAFILAITVVGLACLGPLAIAAIVVNALLLNNVLNRKAAQAQYMTMQQPGGRP